MAATSGVGGGPDPLRDAPRFAEILREAADLLWETDVGGRFSFVGENSLGVDPGALRGRSPAESLDLRGADEAWWRETLTAGLLPFRHREAWLRTGDGSSRCLLFSGSPVTDGGGAFAGYRGVARDVTALRVTAQRLALAEDRFRTAFQGSIVPTVISSLRDGRVVDANEAFARTFGCNRQEVVGRTAAELGVLFDPSRRREAIARLEREGKALEEITQVDARGRTRHFLCASRQLDLEGEPHLFVSALEVTREREAEAEVRHQEESLRELVEDLPILLLRRTPQGIITQVNRAVADLVGMPPEEFVGRSISDFLLPEDLPRVTESMRHATPERPLQSFEFRIRLPDGRIRWLRGRSRTIFRQGAPVEVRVVSEDITDQKEAEIRLRESEERSRAIVESAPFGVFVHDRRKMLLHNQRTLEILGYSPGESLAGRELMDFVHPEDRAMVGQVMEAREKNLLPRLLTSLRVVRRDGSLRDVEGSTEVVRLGGRSLHVTSFRDVTEELEIQTALRESEERFKVLSEDSPNGILIHDRDQGRVVYANRQAELLFGYSQEELTSPAFDPFGITDTAGHQRLREILGPQGPAPPISPLELRIRTRRGTWRDVLLQARPARYRGSHLVIAVITDITQRRLMEQRLRESEEQFRSLAEQFPNAVFIHDLESRRTRYLNPMAERLTGFPREVQMGEEFDPNGLIAPECRSEVNALFALHLDGQEAPSLLVDVITAAGKRLRCLLNSVRLEYGGRPAVMTVLGDLTSLHEVEQGFRLLLEASPMGILVHQEGKVVLANPAAAEILRARHPGDLLGRGVMSFIPPESRALVQERYAALKGKEARLPPVEYPIVTLDGTPITVEVVTRSLLHQGEHRALTMMRDVTRCRKAEEEVAAIRAGLETRNRRLTEEGQVRETAARELERRFREAAAQERRVLEALGSLLAESGRESEGRILLERMGEAAARREDAVALCLDLLRPLKGETVGQVP